MRPLRIVPCFLGLGLWLGIASSVQANDRWVSIESPYFTIHAQCDPTEAREWAMRFEQFRRYISDVLRVAPTELRPMTIVMFKNRPALLPYLPHQDGKDPTNLSSQTTTLPTGTILITSLNWADSVTRHSFYEGGTYWFLGGFKHPSPDWFQAGLAQTFKTFSVTPREFEVGESPKENLLFLQRYRLMPLSDLFGTEMKQLDFHDSATTSLFFSESWALVHYLIFGRDRSRGVTTRSPQLTDFMEALQNGEATEPAFQQVFGTDYVGMIGRLETYITRGNYSIYREKFDSAALTTDFKTTVESAAGVEMILGYASLAGEQKDRAKAHFLNARRLPDGELRAEEALGDVASLMDDEAEAVAHYSRAVELGSRNYRAYFFLGTKVVRDNLRSGERAAHFEADAARLAASRFEQAINLYPRYVPSYEGLASLMPGLETFSDDDRKFLELGVRVSPENDVIEAGLASWEIRNHQEEKGRQRLSSLVAPGRKPTAWVAALAAQLRAADAVGEDLKAVRKLVSEGKTDQAEELIVQRLNDSTDDAQRAALTALRVEVGQLDMVMQAEKLAGEEDWDAAASIARNALDANLPPPLAQRAQAVLARAQAKK